MSHEISVQNGVAEMVSGSGILPWHFSQTQCTIVEGLMTADEALTKGHLNWTVRGHTVQVNGQTLAFPQPGEKGKRLDCWQGICREDTGACLGIVRGQYEPIQNKDAFSFFDRLIGQGKAVYDTAGALRGGRQVWLLAKVDGEIQINGDAHRQYALMLTSHDSSYALQVQWVLTRVVCANTLSIALSNATNTAKIRHTRNWKDAEAEAARVMGLGEHYFKSIQEHLAGLNSQLLSPDQMEDFTKLLLPSTPGTEDSTRVKNIRTEIQTLFTRGQGNHGSSRWDALQAVSDYTDHAMTLRGKASTRLESALQGAGAKLKQDAFDLLTGEDLLAQLLAVHHKPEQTPTAQGTDFARLMGN